MRFSVNLKLNGGWALIEIDGQDYLLQDCDFNHSPVKQQGVLYFLNYLQIKYGQIAVDFEIIILKMNHLMFAIGSYL